MDGWCLAAIGVLAISRAWGSYGDFLMDLERKGMFIMIMGIALDVYPTLIHPFRPTLPYPFPCPLPHFSCRWYIYTCTCIHDLRITYTHIHMHASGRRHDKKKKKDTRDTYVLCTRAFSDKKGLPTINHAKFFAQFIRVVDTRLRFLLTRVANYHLLREWDRKWSRSEMRMRRLAEEGKEKKK